MNEQGDQRELHDSGREVDLAKLDSIGVQYHHCPALADVDAIARERSYTNRDEVWVSPQKFGGDEYDKKLAMFFAEHIHEDEEIRYITGGSGFFDVRDKADEWVRIQLQKDDMIILPAGICHRFTPDVNNVSSFVFMSSAA